MGPSWSGWTSDISQVPAPLLRRRQQLRLYFCRALREPDPERNPRAVVTSDLASQPKLAQPGQGGGGMVSTRGHGTNSYSLKISPASDCAPRISSEIPAKRMIPIDRGEGVSPRCVRKSRFETVLRPAPQQWSANSFRQKIPRPRQCSNRVEGEWKDRRNIRVRARKFGACLLCREQSRKPRARRPCPREQGQKASRFCQRNG
jgi:hypothetical protein